MLAAIDKITRKASRIRNGNDKIEPGQPVRMSEAAAPMDYVRQGDLYIVVMEATAIPAGFVGVKKPKDVDRQLVPGNTQGSKHCLDSLAGVRLFRPADWNDKYEGLDGPCLVLSEERTIEHPTHGSVTIPAGFAVQCRYQREWDAEQRRERRNAD